MLFAMPGPGGEYQDSQADLMDPDNHARVMAFLQSHEWERAKMGESVDLAKWDALVNKARELKTAAGNIVKDAVDTVKALPENTASFFKALAKVPAAFGALPSLNVDSGVIFDLVIGLLDGLSMGTITKVIEPIRDAVKKSPVCQSKFEEVKASFPVFLSNFKHFFSNIIKPKSVKEGFASGRQVGISFLDVCGALRNFAAECPAISETLLGLIKAIGIAAVLVLLAFFVPVIGWLVKVGGAVMTLILGIGFLNATVKKIAALVEDSTLTGRLALVRPCATLVGITLAAVVTARNTYQNEKAAVEANSHNIEGQLINNNDPSSDFLKTLSDDNAARQNSLNPLTYLKGRKTGKILEESLKKLGDKTAQAALKNYNKILHRESKNTAIIGIVSSVGDVAVPVFNFLITKTVQGQGGNTGI